MSGRIASRTAAFPAASILRLQAWLWAEVANDTSDRWSDSCNASTTPRAAALAASSGRPDIEPEASMTSPRLSGRRGLLAAV